VDARLHKLQSRNCAVLGSMIAEPKLTGWHTQQLPTQLGNLHRLCGNGRVEQGIRGLERGDPLVLGGAGC
jgi:hypothetical protein